MAKHVHHRKQYGSNALLEHSAGNDPLVLFGNWLQEAEEADVLEHHAMTLSTCGVMGPSSRIVLLRSFDVRGFVFFSNYNSRKAMDLERDARASLQFFWPQLERQVRIEGVTEKVGAAESDTYFATRPRASRIGAWASDQSRPVADRASLDDRYTRWKDRFGEGDVPRPVHWGGYRVHAARMEFWQGRPGRLHDRLLYLHDEDGAWSKVRLQP